VSISIRDVDTKTTVESQHKLTKNRLAVITLGAVLPGRTMITQKHLHKIQ
jgi:hypothetical protein